MVTRLSPDVRKVILDSATAEVHRLGDRRIGTQHLLLALLHDKMSISVRVLGVDLAAARSSLTELDRTALAAIGINATPLDQPRPSKSRRRPTLTSGARKVLVHAVHKARSDGASRIEERHILYGILSLERPDAAADMLAAMGVNAEEALDKLEEAVA